MPRKKATAVRQQIDEAAQSANGHTSEDVQVAKEQHQAIKDAQNKVRPRSIRGIRDGVGPTQC